MKRLLEGGVDPNAKDANGTPALLNTVNVTVADCVVEGLAYATPVAVRAIRTTCNDSYRRQDINVSL